jgi:hypothetical protein
MLAESNSIGCIGDGGDDLADWEELADFVALVVVLTYLPPSLDDDVFHVPASLVEPISGSSMGFWAIPSDELHESRVTGEHTNPISGVPSKLGNLAMAQAFGHQQRDSMMRVSKPLQYRSLRPVGRPKQFHILPSQVSDRSDGLSCWDSSFSKHTFANVTFIRLSRECRNSRSVSLQCLNFERRVLRSNAERVMHSTLF